MARSSCLVVIASLLLALPVVGAAQTAKPPPRLPPPTSKTSQIPGGPDTGTPAGSDSMQLGTPVMSNSTGQPSSLGQSAAARAAARPKPTASSADCTKPLPQPTGDAKEAPPLPKATVTGKSKAPPPKPPVAPGATRIDC